jgi:phosphoglycolate phosphatase
MNAALVAHGEPPRAPEDLYPWIGPPIHEAFETLLEGDVGAADELVRRYRARYREHSAEESDVVPGIPEALEALHGRVPLSVATSKPKALAVPLLEALGLARFFDAITGPSMEARSEPKAITLDRALQILPRRRRSGPPMMVGDRLHDVDAAHAHGVRCVGVLWGIGDEAELRAAGADVLVGDPAELPGVLLGG